ncbi:MAG: sugar transporter [Rhodoferax sp.]|uniref:polysaccharide biosynthesis/export family protein n=1 Tax=Rhodoferax sp. TaxID=50421 RepID=UPI0013FFF95E|nr:SLBB domain-containing protein [Rhodoferax sp.]NDP38892.1 sugar transporter [Rhodoferax sp.]
MTPPEFAFSARKSAYKLPKAAICVLIVASLFSGLSSAQVLVPPGGASGNAAGYSSGPSADGTGATSGYPSSAPSTTLSPASMGAARAAGLNGAADAAGNQAGAGQATDQANAGTPRAKLPRLGSNQFADFVQETTGRTLPLYGYNLFDGNGFPALSNVPVPANYVLGPGDDISIKIWGAIDVNLNLTIDRNGQVTIPKVGPVTVAGTRADQLEALLKTHIGRVYSNFELSATLGRLRSVQVFVVGQARQPGVHTVSSLSTLISVLFESGGPSATGSMRQIRLTRAGKTISTLDLYKFIHSGDTSADARLLPGDVIVIPPAGPRVALLGALDSAAIYELSGKEETLANLLSYGGGQQILTTPHKVLVERINPAQDKAPRVVEERALNADGLNSTVRDGDVVTLFKISPKFDNAVTLRGNVAKPLRYAYRPGMKVSDLIPEVSALIQEDYYSRKNIMVQYESPRQSLTERTAEGVNYGRDGNIVQNGANRQSPADRASEEGNYGRDGNIVQNGANKQVSADQIINDVKNQLNEINWDYASIERLDAKELRTTLIPFNLGKAIKDKDPANDIPLQAGDVVTIFSVNDLPVPAEKRSQFVRVSGEVMVPGIYQIQPGETLPGLIQRVGGFSQNAFVYGTVFARESTRVQQQDNINKSMRRMESDINAQTASALQNASSADKATTLQAQLTNQKSLLSRLQSLRANGRIALELDPDNPVPPAIALEDGDQIFVPHRPSFVGVFGEVFAESSFIYKPGSTVSHYIDKAGLTRDADTDNLLLIRADGSVEGSARRSSFWSSGVLNKKLNPGDSIFVPGLIDRRTTYTQFMEGAKDWTTLLYQFGLGAAALQTIRN